MRRERIRKNSPYGELQIPDSHQNILQSSTNVRVGRILRHHALQYLAAFFEAPKRGRVVNSRLGLSAARNRVCVDTVIAVVIPPLMLPERSRPSASKICHELLEGSAAQIARRYRHWLLRFSEPLSCRPARPRGRSCRSMSALISCPMFARGGSVNFFTNHNRFFK